MGTMDTMVVVAQIFWLRTIWLRARELMCRVWRIRVHPLWARLLASCHVVSLILSRGHGCITTYLWQARKPRLCITSGACSRTSVSTQDWVWKARYSSKRAPSISAWSLSPSTMHSELSHICHPPNLEAQGGSDYESRNREEAGWAGVAGARIQHRRDREECENVLCESARQGTQHGTGAPPGQADVTKPPGQVTPWKPTVA